VFLSYGYTDDSDVISALLRRSPHHPKRTERSMSGDNSSSGGSLPDEIVQAIAISNAKSIGEQPAILANMALANQILNQNLQQQNLIAQQQAMNQIVMATMAKCVALITGNDDDPNKTATAAELALLLSKLTNK
jgi:hypothetical protein